MNPISTIQNIYAVAILVYNQVKTAKGNKEQCKRLSERVKIIEAALKGLEQIKDKEHYLGLAAQQIVNREADKNDQAIDLSFIQKNQETLRDYNPYNLKES